MTTSRWAAVGPTQDGKRLYAWDGERWRYEWPLLADVQELVAFAREHLPRVNGGLQSLEPQQRCYYVQLRSSEECEDRGDQDFPSAAPPSPASPATSVARR